MTSEEARSLILFEGRTSSFEPQALFLRVRMGDDPGSQRMERLQEAVEVMCKSLKGQTTLDRELAGAMWVLGTSVIESYDSWQRNGNNWRGAFHREILDLTLAIERVFVDSSTIQ